MKNIIFLFLLAITIIGCTKDAPKLEAFNPEAFAFDIGDSWEENEIFKASLAFSVDLITPEGDTIPGLITRVEDLTNNEKVIDTSLEAQFELDSTYSSGKYKIIFNVKDVNSEGTASISTGFELSEE
jgi:hypothetical protein